MKFSFFGGQFDLPGSGSGSADLIESGSEALFIITCRVTKYVSNLEFTFNLFKLSYSVHHNSLNPCAFYYLRLCLLLENIVGV
jgi:hypothetical protein